MLRWLNKISTREFLKIEATENKQESIKKKQEADAVDVGNKESINQQEYKTKVHPHDHRRKRHSGENYATNTRHNRTESIHSPEYWMPEYPWLTKDFYNEEGEIDERTIPLTTFEDVPARLFFHVISLMWRSNISTLFKAVLRITGEKVVLKIIKKAQNTKQRQMMLTEQRVMALSKNNTCLFMTSYHSSFQTKSYCFLVMEFVGGVQLSLILDKVGCISESAATFYIAQIALGMFFLHQKRVILRGLSTSNIVVGDDGHLRLYDFSSCADNVGPGEFIAGFVGNVDSSAPEMLFDTIYNKAVDYWGIGVILYKMVSGKMPFFGTTRAKLFKAISCEQETYNTSLSEGTVDLCKNLLTKDQKCRLGYGSDAEEQFKSHKFFDKLSWMRMEERLYNPPYVPNDEDYEVLTASWDFTADQEMIVKKKVVEAFRRLSESNSTSKVKLEYPRKTRSSKVSSGSSLSLTFLDRKLSHSKRPEVVLSSPDSRTWLTTVDEQYEPGECSHSFRKRGEKIRNSLAIPSALDTSISISTQFSHFSQLSAENDSSGQPDSIKAPQEQVRHSVDANFFQDSRHRSLSQKSQRSGRNSFHGDSISQTMLQVSKKRKRKRKSFLYRCKPFHWKQWYQRCLDSFRACLADKVVTCRAVCCGLEDYEALGNEQPVRSSPSMLKPQKVLGCPKSACSFPYTVDFFGEINTTDTQDCSKPGEWIGLGSHRQSRPQNVKAELKPSTSA